MHLNKIILSNMCIRRHRFYNVDPELTEIPEHIVQCYTNYELWDRYKRLPSSIDFLVALIRYFPYKKHCSCRLNSFYKIQSFPWILYFLFVIRKVESDQRAKGWSMGHLAGSLLHNFRFDGIKYDRCIDTTTGAFPIR